MASTPADPRVEDLVRVGKVQIAVFPPEYTKDPRPSIDPELMIRMLIIGYVFAIRSERAKRARWQQ